MELFYIYIKFIWFVWGYLLSIFKFILSCASKFFSYFAFAFQGIIYLCFLYEYVRFFYINSPAYNFFYGFCMKFGLFIEINDSEANVVYFTYLYYFSTFVFNKYLYFFRKYLDFLFSFESFLYHIVGKL